MKKDPSMTENMSPAVQEAVQRVDAQILHHLGLVQELKSERNTLMPISRLPAEILARIFHEVRGNNGHNQDNSDAGPSFTEVVSSCEPSLEWISISHVSRHWRDVAINEASLWTDPPLLNLKGTMIMLERSRMATIPAIALKVEELDKRVVTALTPHIPRVAVLVIPTMAPGTLKQALSSLPPTATKLEALSINTLIKTKYGEWTWYRRFTRVGLDEAVAFPDNILCHTPKLRHLQLNGIAIKSDSPLLSHLTTLSMSGIPEKNKPTPQQFRTMIQSAPYLESLELKDACPSFGSNQQKEWTSPVLMQYLEYLNIEDTIPRLIYFFRTVSATHLLNDLNIYVEFVEGSVSDLPFLFTVLDQPYVRSLIGSSTDVRQLDIGIHEGTPLVRASNIPISKRNLEPDERAMLDDSPSMMIWFHRDLDELDEHERMELMDNLVVHLFNGFTWTGLAELDISSLEYASPQVLSSTFGTIPQLRIILADTCVLSFLVTALTNRPSTGQVNLLESLSLPFPGVRHIDMGHGTLTHGMPGFEALRKCLQQRHKCGMPIISLNLSHCGLLGEAVSILKKYVKHIILKPEQSKHRVVDSYSPYKHDWYT